MQEIQEMWVWSQCWEDPNKLHWSGVGNGTPLQYSCLGNSLGKGAWWAAVHGAAKSWTQLTHWTTANLMGCHCWDYITVQNEKHVDTEKAWARMWSFFPDSGLGFPGWLDSRFSLWLPPAPSGKASILAILWYPSVNSKHVCIWPPLSVCPGEHPVLPVFSNSTH